MQFVTFCQKFCLFHQRKKNNWLFGNTQYAVCFPDVNWLTEFSRYDDTLSFLSFQLHFFSGNFSVELFLVGLYSSGAQNHGRNHPNWPKGAMPPTPL